MEGDAADHAVFDILIVFEFVLVVVEVLHIGSYLESDGARTKRCGIVVFHQAARSFIVRPAGYRDLRHDLDLHIVFCKLGDFHGEVLHLGVCRRCLVRLGGLGLHDVQILFYGFCAGEAAGVVRTHRINARLVFLKIDVDEMGVVVLRDPFVVAVVCLHVVAVLFLDELTFHAEVGNDILIGCVKNIIVDLVHPDVALLNLLLGHDAVSSGGHRIRRSERSAFRRNNFLRRIFSDGIRHGLACVNQRQIPGIIKIRQILLVHIDPIGSPWAQIDIIVEFIPAVFIITVNVDHVSVVRQPRINNPVRVLKRNIREGAALGHHSAIYTGPIATEADRCGNHRLRFCVVPIPEDDGAHAVCTDVNGATDIPPSALHTLILVVARTARHNPPAVPVAIPPVEQRVSGPGRLCRTAPS